MSNYKNQTQPNKAINMSVICLFPVILIIGCCYGLQQMSETHQGERKVGQTNKNILWEQKYMEYEEGDEELKLCPGSDVMKSRYQCFVYNVEDVEQAIDTKITNLFGLHVPSICIRTKNSVYRPSDNMPAPDGGFNKVQYSCSVRRKN